MRIVSAASIAMSAIRTLTAGFAVGRGPPSVERSMRQPHGQVATTPEPVLVFRPVSYPILRLRVLVLASLRILHRWPLRGRGAHLTWKLQPGAVHQRLSPIGKTDSCALCGTCTSMTVPRFLGTRSDEMNTCEEGAWADFSA